MNPSALARVRTVLLDLVTQGVLPGAVALVQHRGRTVLHEAVGLQRPANPAQPGLAVPAMAPDTVFRIYSMTKPIASLVALMLMEEGRLLLAHPVSRYLPAFKGQQVYDAATGTLAPAAREATVHDLLRHTAGLGYAWDTGPIADQYRNARVGSRRHSNQQLAAALRAQDWGVVRDSIQAMPAELAAKPEWTYWLGRALHAGGRTTEGNALFEKIAGQANFYGNLADEELGRTVVPPPKASAATSEEQRAARDNPAIRRALAFFRNDMRTEAVREWNWALRGMDDRQLLAAADLAKRNQIWDRAINTADRTKNEHDYSLRFLAPYGETVRPAAQNQSLDDAWVYGLMRQESRFITSAKSNVGASGLMQLMHT